MNQDHPFPGPHDEPPALWFDIAFTVLLVLTPLLPFLALGCDQPEPTPSAAIQRNYRVELYSGGQKIGEWESESNAYIHSGHCNFTDKASGREIDIAGDIVVTELASDEVAK